MTDSLTELVSTPVAEATPADQAPSDFLSQYVGEGKKYANEQELAKAHAHAQEHIKKLETENSSYAEDLVKTNERSEKLESKVEDIVTRLGKESTTTDTTPAPQPTVADAPSVTPDDLDSRVAAALQNIHTAQQKADNVKKSSDLLQAEFGADKLPEIIKTVVAGNPTKQKLIDQLAEQSPEEVLNYIKAIRPAEAVPKTDSVTLKAPTQSPKDFTSELQPDTWGYYQDLRRKNPREYEKQRLRLNTLVKKYKSEGRDFFKT